MWVPVCMLVLTSTVLFRSRWCVVISVTSIDANCGQVGIRSPHGCVRSTIRTLLLKHAPKRVELLSALGVDRLKDEAQSRRHDAAEQDRGPGQQEVGAHRERDNASNRAGTKGC